MADTTSIVGPQGPIGPQGIAGLLKSYANDRNGWISLSYTERV